MTARTFPALLPAAALGLALAAGCKDYSELYCDEDQPCTDPARPFCDLRGEHPASEGIGKTCIPSPFDSDAGPDPDAGPDDEPDAAGPERIVEVAAGFSHTCARTNYGRVRCWGYSRMLGWEAPENIGDDEYPRDGEDVPLPEPALQLALTESHTCALTSSHRIICWGGNGTGALGVPPDDRNTPPTAFADVPGEFVEVDVGLSFTCGRLRSGDVRCWGNNTFGALGIGSTEHIGDDESPGDGPLVALPGPAVALRSQASYSCAILEGGAVYCWGRNEDGVLGLGHSLTIGDDETPVDGGATNVGLRVAAVDTGDRHTCAMSTGGHVRCWGLNMTGRLGRGEETEAVIGDEAGDMPPPSVELAGEAVAIGIGTAHSCALLDNQTLRCWGSAGSNGTSEHLGDDEPVSEAPAVSVGAPVTQLSAGTAHTCVITDESTVRCWGGNIMGALGYATTETIGDDEAPAVYGDVPVFPDL